MSECIASTEAPVALQKPLVSHKNGCLWDDACRVCVYVYIGCTRNQNGGMSEISSLHASIAPCASERVCVSCFFFHHIHT